MICFEHASKFILSDITLHIPQGSATGLIGASGAGKTTLLKLACGLLEPSAGNVYTMRRSPVKHRQEIGASAGVFFAGLPVFRVQESVEANFQDFKLIYRIPDAFFAREYAALSERLGFASYEKEPAGQLSLGQRRRAELGALLLSRPKLLLLDEPCTGLDQTAKDTLQELLAERQNEGMTLVISSHAMEEISGLCERLLLLDHGALRYYGDRELFLKRFAPVEIMELTFAGKLPDLEDLPLQEYSLHQNTLRLTYHSNHVTAAELLQHILKQTHVTAVTTKKSGLADIIRRMEKGEINEFY